MTEQQPIILNNPTPVAPIDNQIDKEVVIKEDYAEELTQDLKKHMHEENLEIILPDKLEIKEKKKEK